MVGTLSIMNTKATIEVVGIVIGDPQDWSTLVVGPEKRIYNSFDNCVVPLYKCMFNRIGLWLPFCDFQSGHRKAFKGCCIQDPGLT